ncbi:hypothetical protein OG21DRAFT_1525024 [Imleria badia]|nr:hypothetical protein OG21DRAFT_1525024 [Imleria badia]
MPHCPRCYKFFSNPKGLAHHRSQPKSACNANPPSKRVVVRVRQRDDLAGSDSQSVDSEGLAAAEWDTVGADKDPATQSDSDVIMNEVDIDKEPPPPADAEPEPIHHAIRTLHSTTSWVVDLYLNAGKVEGRGETFLAHFKLDGLSDYRKLNLCHPFSTLEDWQMANFLLTS